MYVPPSFLIALFQNLGSLLLLCLERLLSVAPYHNDRQETANHGGAQDDQDHRDANSPDAGKEEGM